MGIQIKTLREGDSKSFPKPHQIVTVHYVGTLKNGIKFDSSRERGTPFQFKLGEGNVIKGWDIGVAQMSKGQVALLTITSEYAYGQKGVESVIPSNATLIFQIELIDFK